MRQRAAIPFATVLLLGCGLTGCVTGSGHSTSASPTTGPVVSTSAASPTPSPTPTALALPGGCDQLLPFTALDQSLGRPLFGETVYIKGQAEPSINRTGRVTCRFGIKRVKGKAGAAPLEVGVSSYADADAATRRVAATISAARASGAAQTQATVAGGSATILSGPSGSTLVLAKDDRTIAVTVLPKVLKTGTAPTALAAVAELVLKNLP